MNAQALNLPAAGKWIAAFLLAHWLAVPAANRSAIVTLLIFMGLDLFTGLWAAWLDGKVCSEQGIRGVSRKLATLTLLLFCHLLEERALHIELNLDLAGAIGYTLNEAISIIENLSRIGVPIPSPVVDALMKVKHLKIKGATPEQLERLKKAQEGE